MNCGEVFVTTTNEVRLEISTECSYSCRFCPHSEKLTRKKEIMSNDLFKSLLLKVKNQAPQITDLTLSGLGESTLDKDLLKKVEFAINEGYKIHILSNGSIISIGRLKRLIDLRVSDLRFSVHAVDSNKYNYVVGRRVNINSIIEKIEKSYLYSRNKNTKIIVTSDIIDQTLDQIEKIKQKFLLITDLLEIWRVHNWADGFNFRNRDREKTTCGRPFHGPLQIQVDGTVNACGFDYDGKLLLGDLKNQSLKEIFNSDEYKRISDFHSDINSRDDIICNGCDQLREDLGSVIFNSKYNAKDRVGKTSTNYKDLEK